MNIRTYCNRFRVATGLGLCTCLSVLNIDSGKPYIAVLYWVDVEDYQELRMAYFYRVTRGIWTQQHLAAAIEAVKQVREG